MNVVKAKNLEAHSGQIEHGFFGRQGGVSEGIYKGLNCGSGSNDTVDKVIENRRIVASYFGQGAGALHSVWQVHSPDCIVVEIGNRKDMQVKPQADAMVTDAPNQILGVLTADCGPILFSGIKQDGSPVVGAAHAGWKGAVGGVLQSTVESMIELGAEIGSIQAAVGPCIGPKSYEVSEAFITPFMEQDEVNEHFFKDAQKAGHLMFDLPGYIASRLAVAGVKDITITGHDTCAHEERFFSYRRKTHRDEPDYGRQISAIMIKG